MYPGSSGVLIERRGEQQRPGRRRGRTRSSSTAAMARAARCRIGAGQITLHDCAIESMRHSLVRRRTERRAVVEVGRADTNRRPRPRARGQLARRPRVRPPFRGARLRRRAHRPDARSASSAACKNQPSQTLSPLPPAPTRFMPSFQSPPADQRQTVAADRQSWCPGRGRNARRGWLARRTMVG